MVRLTLLMLINIFKAVLAFAFVIKSIKLLSSFIYFTFVICYCLYYWQRLIILIISYFSLKMPNLIKHLYNDFELVQMIIRISYSMIWKNVAFNIMSILKPWVFAYSSKASTLFITYLHFIKDQCKMLVVLDILIKNMT